LPFESRAAPYERLIELTGRVRDALREGRVEALDSLVEEHRAVCGELGEVHASLSPVVLTLVREAKQRVDELLGELRERRDRVEEELIGRGKKKKGLAAYEKVGRRV